MTAIPASTGICYGGQHKELAKYVKKLILIHNVESVDAVSPSVLGHQPDWRVGLTAKGAKHASTLGRKLSNVLKNKGPVFFYVSPYERAKQTYIGLRSSLPKSIEVNGAKEEPRLVDQQVGNYQNPQLTSLSELRRRYGKFFFRYREGESGADVYSRVSAFIENVSRDVKKMGRGRDQTIAVVSHGMPLRCLIMRLFDMSIDDFEKMVSPLSGSIVVLTRGENNFYQIDGLSRHAMRFPEVVACPTHGLDCRVGKAPTGVK